MELENAQLLEYAVSRFQVGKYDEALEAFMLAYSRGYEQEWIIENIYSCYMWGNDDVFRKAYEQQTVNAEICYEDCLLDFVPYRDGEYYIFDKGIGIFRGKFSMDALEEVKLHAGIEKIEYGAVVFEMDWNWNDRWNILTAAKDRKIYVIGHDMQRLVSFYKIPELASYMKNIMEFSSLDEFQVYFHTNTSVYLPYVVLGNEEQKQELMNVIEREHQYRLTPAGRNVENVLLTIGIPTHNRGNLLLERMKNLCKMPYDAEVEFAVSKHGTKCYEEEYKCVEAMTDARINYHAHDRELKALENWHYTVEMSHGKYVLFVSDEDDVLWGALEHYLKLLQQNNDVNLLRAKTTIQYGSLDEKRYGKKGFDAFQAMFLRQNYLSGLIVRREDFLKADLLQLERFSDNDFYIYYPHEWWCAMMSRYGDYMEEPVTLIRENESVVAEETARFQRENGIEEEFLLPVYATYEARLRQFKGQIEFVCWFMKDDKKALEFGLGQVFGKVNYLLEMAREYQYDKNDFEEFIDRYLWMCMNTIDEVPLDNEQKVRLLQWIQKLGNDSLKLHERLNTEELTENQTEDLS